MDLDYTRLNKKNRKVLTGRSYDDVLFFMLSVLYLFMLAAKPDIMKIFNGEQ